MWVAKDKNMAFCVSQSRHGQQAEEGSLQLGCFCPVVSYESCVEAADPTADCTAESHSGQLIASSAQGFGGSKTLDTFTKDVSSGYSYSVLLQKFADYTSYYNNNWFITTTECGQNIFCNRTR